MRGALLRYRIIAWIVGFVLLTLVFATWPLEHWGDHNLVVIAWTSHGYLFLVYVILAFDLSRRVKWKIWQTVLVLASGTIPFLSFVAEHYATIWTREKIRAIEQDNAAKAEARAAKAARVARKRAAAAAAEAQAAAQSPAAAADVVATDADSIS